MANFQLSSNLLPQSKLAILNQNTLKTLRWISLDRLKSQDRKSRRVSHSYSLRYHPTNSRFLLQVCPQNVDSCGAWSGYCWERELLPGSPRKLLAYLRHIIVNKEAGCCVFQASVQLPTKTTVAPVCSCEPAQARQPVSVTYVIRGVPARLTQLSPHRAAARPAPRKATALCLTAESVYARQKMSGVR